MFVHLRSYCVQALPFLNPVFGTSCAASFRHVHLFVFILRSGSFPAHPYLPCVYAGVQVPLFLCPCAPVPLRPVFLRRHLIPAPMRPVFLRRPALLFLRRPAPLFLRRPAPSFLRRHARSFAFMLRPGPSFSRSPCVRDLLHRGLVLPRFAMFTHLCSCCVQAPSPLAHARPAFMLVFGSCSCAPAPPCSRSPMFNPVFMLVFGTSCTEALCGLVSPCSLIRVHAASGSFLFSFALRSGPPAQRPCATSSRPCLPIAFMLCLGPSFSCSPCVQDLLHRGLVRPCFAHARSCVHAAETAEMKTRLQFGETQSKPIILPLGGTQLESE
jgi:hypothetical protein